MTGFKNHPGTTTYRLYRSKGFTLVELLVVLMILSTVLAVAAISILGWIDHTQYQKQNEYAQTLFVALQNQLTEYQENRQLTALQEELTDSQGNYQSGLEMTEDLLRQLTGEDGTPVLEASEDLSKIWPESRGKDNPQEYQGTLCHLTVSKADYQAYQEGTLTDAAKLEVYDLLSEYVYDQSILDAAISLEISPDSGEVYSVLYSEIDTSFVYEETESEKGGVVDIRNRESTVRREYMIGYYGVDTLHKSVSEKAEAPVLSKVLLYNKETLNLSFEVTGAEETVESLVYEITVCSKEGTSLLQIDLDGDKLQKKDAAEEAVSCEVTWLTGEERTQEMPIMAWTEGTDGSKIRVILDAADLEAGSSAYLAQYTLLSEGSDRGQTADFTKTLSFRRFGLAEDEIYCTVQGVSDTEGVKTTARDSNWENVYFAAVRTENSETGEEDTEKTVYEIENCRHLYNIRYVEDYMEEVRPEALKTQGVQEYLLTEDLDWKEFIKNGSLYKNSRKVSATNPDSETDLDFPALVQLRSGNILTSKNQGTDGKGYAIANLSLSEAANLAAGSDENKRIQNLHEELAWEVSDARTPSGLVLVNGGEISHLTLEGVQVKGECYVGSFCGLNTEEGTLTDLKTDLEGKLEGICHVGGIAGTQLTTEAQTKTAFTFENLQNYAEVYGTACTGGILGSINMDDGEEGASGCTAELKSCENFGAVTARALSSQEEQESAEGESGITVGRTAGILGYVNGSLSGSVTVTDCVNVGCIEGEGSLAGITVSEGTALGTVTGCRNYGNSSGTDFAGIMSGSCEELSYCFSLSNSKRLTASFTGTVNCAYYLKDTYENITQAENTVSEYGIPAFTNTDTDGDKKTWEIRSWQGGQYNLAALEISRDPLTAIEDFTGVSEKNKGQRQLVYEEADPKLSLCLSNLRESKDLEILEEPQLHLELADDSQFRIYLDQGTYSEGTEILVSFSNEAASAVTFKASAGCSDPFTLKANGEFTVTAAAKNTKGSSGIILRKAQAAGSDALKAGTLVQAEISALNGELPYNLSGQIQFTNTGSTGLYYHTELLIRDYEIRDTAGSVSQDVIAVWNMTLISQGASVTSSLTGLPEAFASFKDQEGDKEIVLRSYPWKDQYETVWYGHTVKSGMTKAEFLQEAGSAALTDPVNQNEVFQTDGQLKEGYALRYQEEEDSLEIIYSPVLAYSDVYGIQITQGSFVIEETP